MLQNAYLLAKIGADTAENEQHFAGGSLDGQGPPRVPQPRPRSPAGPEAGRAMPGPAAAALARARKKFLFLKNQNIKIHDNVREIFSNIWRRYNFRDKIDCKYS